MAKCCEPERLGPDPSGTVQNFQWMAATLRHKKRIQNPGLPLDRLVPIVEDQVKVICKQFVKAQDFPGHNLSTHRSWRALEGPLHVRGDPPAIEVAGLCRHTLFIHPVLVHHARINGFLTRSTAVSFFSMV